MGSCLHWRMKWRKPVRDRLQGHDYRGPGVYFVTFCVRDRLQLLADSREAGFVLNRFGRMVVSCWEDLPAHYRHVQLDRMVVMPNHLHGILIFRASEVSRKHDLFEVVRAMKSFSARRINEIRKTPGTSVWQRGFYHSVINNRPTLHAIRDYIRQNPARWQYRTTWAGLRPAPIVVGGL